MRASFSEADQDGDGRLNFGELKNFVTKIKESLLARGLPSQDPTEFTDEVWSLCFQQFNSMNPYDANIGYPEAIWGTQGKFDRVFELFVNFKKSTEQWR